MATSAAATGEIHTNVENKAPDIDVLSGPSDISEPDNVLRIVDEHEDKNLSRSLNQRHIQMIALAGAIVSTIFLPLLPANVS